MEDAATQPIYIKFPQATRAGGPSTFLKNLGNYLERHGLPIAGDPDKAWVILFPNKFDERVIKRMRARGAAVVQRLDGVYYPSKHGASATWRNKPIGKMYRQFADFVVFQSEYSRATCFAAFGEKPPERYSLIYNGADPLIFHPDPAFALAEQEPVRFITTGCYRTIDTLEPMVRALDEISERARVELVVVGPIMKIYSEDFDPTPLLRRSYIRHVDERPLEEVANLLRQSHVYLYSNLNAPCPNAVIEAVSSGLPVVGFQTGSLPELVPFARELLAPVNSRDLWHRHGQVDYRLLRERIELVIKDYPRFRERALDNCRMHDFEKCGARYLDVLKGWLARTPLKRPGWAHRLRGFFTRP